MYTTDQDVRPGDEMIIDGQRVGEPVRTGTILEVRERLGDVSYLVRWDHNGHETVIFPGSDSHVRRLGSVW